MGPFPGLEAPSSFIQILPRADPLTVNGFSSVDQLVKPGSNTSLPKIHNFMRITIVGVPAATHSKPFGKLIAEVSKMLFTYHDY